MAETDTHIFAAADDGFSRSENKYTVSYVWPFDPSRLTPGLDTKKFSDIIRRNLTRLANNTRHNIPLEVALRSVGAEYGVPINMNDVLDKHHYVTVPIITVIILIILTIAVIFGVVIARSIAKSKRQDQVMAHMGKQQDVLFEALRNRKEEEGRGRRGPRKPTAPEPQQTETYSQPGPPSYAAAGRGRPGYAVTPQSPAGRPGYSLRSTAITNSGAAGTRGINSRTLVGHERSRPAGRSSGNARRISHRQGSGGHEELPERSAGCNKHGGHDGAQIEKKKKKIKHD
jgi:type II secretory pathway pseudopilin PulG